MAALLPTLTKIAGPDGATLPDAERMQFLAPLAVEFVPAVNNGPSTVKVRVESGFPDGTLGKLDFARESGTTSGTVGKATLLLFANREAGTYVNQVTFVPEDPLTASDVNYLQFQFGDALPDGSTLGVVGSTVNTKTQASGGTGNWAVGGDAFTAVLDYTLAAGHRLVVSIEPTGTKLMPPGAWVFS